MTNGLLADVGDRCKVFVDRGFPGEGGTLRGDDEACVFAVGEDFGKFPKGGVLGEEFWEEVGLRLP